MAICAALRVNRSTLLCLFIAGSSTVLLLMLAHNPQVTKQFKQLISASLLPYESDIQAKTMLKGLLKTGELLNLARRVNIKAEAASLTEHYPVLSMTGNKFSTLDGKTLNTEDVLRDSLLRSSGDIYPIPNVAHFFTFSKVPEKPPQIQFHEYLALMGAMWLSGIEKLIFWSNIPPVGKYWNMFVKNVTAQGHHNRVMLATRPLPTKVFNQSCKRIEHQVDVMKLQSAILFGGIFLDSDSVTLRSLEPLRRYDCVMGREVPGALSIGALFAKPSSKFVLIWYMLYQTFIDSEWAVHSVLLPDKIFEKFPRLCHVEEDTLVRPNWTGDELNMLYNRFNNKTRRWNWNKNYMVHVWGINRPSENETSVKTLNSMYGQVARHILYGTKELIP